MTSHAIAAVRDRSRCSLPRPRVALNTGVAAHGPADALPNTRPGILPERAGVVSWKTLAQVEPVKKDGKMVPGFSKEILGLDRTDVKVQGFMIPLDIGDKQKRFLHLRGSAALPVLPSRRSRRDRRGRGEDAGRVYVRSDRHRRQILGGEGRRVGHPVPDDRRPRSMRARR